MSNSPTPLQAPVGTSNNAASRASLKAAYYERGYWRAEDLWTTIDRSCTQHADKTAFIAGDTSITFGELRSSAIQLGLGMQRRGLAAGDVVVIHARNAIESAQAMFACAWLGAVMTPIPPMFSVAQLVAVCASSGARMLVSIGESKDVARAIAAAAQSPGVQLAIVPDAMVGTSGAAAWSDLFVDDAAAVQAAGHIAVDADALAMMVYSSGTTGTPKGVMHSANTARYAAEQRAFLHEVTAADTGLVVAQFGFVGSIVFGYLMGTITGMTQLLVHAWNAETTIGLIEKHRITYGLMMPTHVHDVLASPALEKADVSSFSRCGMSGLPRERRLEVQRRLCPKPLPTYGMSECLGYATSGVRDRNEKHIETDGHPFPGTHTIVLGEDGQPAPTGETGPIIVRGPSLFLGYFGSSKLTDAALTEDGYYRTGDIGKLDADGYLSFVARIADVIRRGGIMIVPGDVEAVLMQHPRIEHVAIVALPDPRLGERACACVISRDGAPLALEELTSLLDQRKVARYTWPESVAMFADFPRSASLKVQKRALVEQLVNKTAQG